MRLLTAAQAIREAQAELMSENKNVIVFGEGVPDPKAMFGTTKDLHEEYPEQVFDTPISENGLTGVAVGMAINGLRPILAHMRIDFTLYAADQFINNAAKWWPMFGMQQSVPMVVRAIVGRGWGQGIQHAQQLDSLYASIPGIKVVSISNAYNAKGLLVAAVKDPNPVLFIEHRWVHYMQSDVPRGTYEVEIGKARIAREGKDITVVTWGYMVAETLRASEIAYENGVEMEVIDLQTLRPIDMETIRASVQKTQHLLVVHDGYQMSAIVDNIVAEFDLSSVYRSVNAQKYYCPASPFLSKNYYPKINEILECVWANMELDEEDAPKYYPQGQHDVPNDEFKGPF